MSMSLEEAMGKSATIWTQHNFRRRVMDPDLCRAIANLLVDELTLHAMDETKLADFERLKSGHEKLKAHYSEAQVEIANLKSELETAKSNSAKTLQDELAKLRLELTSATVKQIDPPVQ